MLNQFIAAIVGERAQEKPSGSRASEQPRSEPIDAVDCALVAQASALRAGFTEREAFAQAVHALAMERPPIANRAGRARPMSASIQRSLRGYAGQILAHEQGSAA